MIRFEVIDATFNLRHKNAIKNWIKEIILSKNRRVGDINYVFADDSYVLDVNRTYLSHDYYTDIITFDTSDYEGITSAGAVSADIVISLDTVLANSRTYGSSFSRELYRVMIHGILHLTGNDDLTPEEAELMRQAEDEALSLLPQFQISDDQIYTTVEK
ncbi:MAG TPA: rRNA maturation RNase YbeY [Candidatus Coprenecus stercoravium]|uniref:Endoribonuclease YbeY n=1 Tax=Candidatus Coprenecus stercoravium TaxID=2840735 RepID=A0A9D2GQG0_9BACT|nr:rRNA maturation RNase YbeY [Candidatus Coprenecus stercoravium]